MFNQLRALMYTGQMLQMTAELFPPTTASAGQGGSSSTGETGLQDHSSSSSSSSSDAELGSTLLPARETLLLLLEVMLLDHGPSARRAVTVKYCYQRMQGIWSRMQPDSANSRETADTMLQPVLHLLGAAVLQQLEAASSSSSSSRLDGTQGNGWGDLLGDGLDLTTQFAKLAKWLVAAGMMSLCGQDIGVLWRFAY
jgi:hypothetical protein